MVAPVKSLAIVTPFYPPHVGGVERYAQEFARTAAALGLTVNVVTTDRVRTPQESGDEGIRLLRLPALNVPMMGSHYPITLTGRRLMQRYLDCDVVMAHTRFFMTTLTAAVITARHGKRICILDHGAGPLRTSPKALASAAMLYERLATGVLKSCRPKFFAVSAASSRWLNTFGIYDAPVLPNSVPARSSPLPRRSNSDGKTIIFSAGRLLVEKGVRELITAAETLARQGHNVELRIAGDGPLGRELSSLQMSVGSLVYLGRISASEVIHELQNASVFVNASNLPEGLPTTLLEAGNAGAPVVSTTFGGSAELITHETGWPLSRGEPAQITLALEAVLSRPEEAARKSTALFDRIQRRYTWPRTVEEFLRRAAALN